MHLAWNDWHEPLANTPDSMLPLPFTFNVSDVGLKPYAATPAPETAAAASFCSWHLSVAPEPYVLGHCAFACCCAYSELLHGGLLLGPKVPDR